MAWTTPLTAVANAALTSAQWNASVRDNLAETAPAKATTAGSYFVTTAPNTLAERVPQEAFVTTTETTASTTFVDLTTVGPTITVTTGPLAIVTVTAGVGIDTAGGSGRMSVDVSGATTSAAADSRALRQGRDSAAALVRCSSTSLFTLTAGSNTFTSKYRSTTAAIATFNERRLLVFPL